MVQVNYSSAAIGGTILVVVATKGRPIETALLLTALSQQTRQADAVVVVGSCASDLPDIQMPKKSTAAPGEAVLLVSPVTGLTAQRNFGLKWFEDNGFFANDKGFVAFFDDDFRPHCDWLKGCEETLLHDSGIVGVTGHVLADGIIGPGMTEDEAEKFNAGELNALPHWTNRPHLAVVHSGYGCNMAFRASVMRQTRFDEALPLYGWQEDTDFTGRTRKFGKTVVSRLCKGVHLGVKKGRTSGVRLGYSQISNPLHIAKARNMAWRRALWLVTRAILSNSVKSVFVHTNIDYPGRLRGNLIALIDLCKGRCVPGCILNL